MLKLEDLLSIPCSGLTMLLCTLLSYKVEKSPFFVSGNNNGEGF